MKTKNKFLQLRRIGWVGVVDSGPDFESVLDNYVELGGAGIPTSNVYKNKKDAQRRYQAVIPVFIQVAVERVSRREKLK